MDNFFSLSCGKLNTPYDIVCINSSIRVKRRLLELGFVSIKVVILKKSRSGGVFLLQVRSFVLALKSQEVKNIMVKYER